MSLRLKIPLYVTAVTVILSLLTWVAHYLMVVPGFACVLFIGLWALFVAVVILDRSILRPVLQIIDHVVSIGRTNDLRLRVDVTAPGEMGTLVREFNQMLDRLAEDNARRLYAETQLRRAEDKYRRIVEDSVLGIFQSTPQGRYISANDALVRILGYADSQELRNTVTNIDKQVYLDPRRRAEFIRQVEQRGVVTDFESQVRRKDGGVCWVVEKARVVRDETGGVLCYEGMVEDITERKLAEDQLCKLSCAVDQSPASIVITDLEGRIEYVNRKFTEITGYSALEVLGRKPSILKSGLMPDEVYHALWRAITSGYEWHGELHNRKKDGELYWEWASISPILGVAGLVTHFLAVKEDITERKESDAKLRRTVDQLERFNHLAIGREKRIIELKAAVNELLGRLGEPPRYQVGLDSAHADRQLIAGPEAT